MSEKSNNNGEIGIIELLDYFKRGLKAIIATVQSLFSKVWKLLLYFLLLIKNNLVYIAICVLISIGIGYMMNNYEYFENYGYEMVVQPNFNSTPALYSNVTSLNDQIGAKGSDAFEKNLLAITIEPIKTEEDKINAYYNTVNNDYTTNSYSQINDRDTVFFREIPIKEFEKNLVDQDYTTFKINLKSKTKLNAQQILQKITQPIEETSSYISLREAYAQELDFQNQNLENSIKLIDTLLLSRTDPNKVISQNNIALEGGNPKIMERELLQEKGGILNQLYANTLRKQQNKQVIKIVSQPTQVTPNRKIKRSLPYSVLYGFLFALFTILALRFYKYLNTVETKTA